MEDEQSSRHRFGLAALFVLTASAAIVFAEIRIGGLELVAWAWLVTLPVFLLASWLSRADAAQKLAIVDDETSATSNASSISGRNKVSWIACCFVGFWLIFLLLYLPAFNPLATFSFKLGTSIGTVVAVLCLHHLAHRWWHVLALFLTTILLLVQVIIWSQ